MKKSLIALAVLAASGVASAQSSVTLFGVVDATFQQLKADDNGSVTRLGNSGYNSARLGFRGTEDLGGGMSASFWLESAISNDDGRAGGPSVAGNQALTQASNNGLNFNRRSTVSLAGGFGEIRLGRDYVPAFWSNTNFDPFGTNGSGAHSNIGLKLGDFTGVTTIVRASNSIGYFLPRNLGGFYGQFMYALGENASNSAASTKNDGKYTGFRLGYAAGPLDVALAYGSTKAQGTAKAFTDALGTLLGLPANTLTGSGGKYTDLNIGGSYNFGVVKAMAVWNKEEFKIGGPLGTVDHKTLLIGATVPMGAGEFRASYVTGKATDDLAKGNQLAVGYVHNLSKRTAIYTTYARINNKGFLLGYNNGRALATATINNGAATPFSPGLLASDLKTSGLDIGIRHSF